MNFSSSFDFKILQTKNFKEDSVREEIIAPILEKLGFSSSGKNKIIRSPKLIHPFVTIGSKERPLAIYPDYLLQVDEQNLLVLDAKTPKENIREGKNVRQVYSYCIHPEIKGNKFALCNGYEWVFFRINEAQPTLLIQTEKIEEQWKELTQFIFEIQPPKQITKKTKNDEWYLNRPLPQTIEKPRKNAMKRHFGVHGYFTKQSWDIVDRHVNNFTQIGDLVLDSYGGSGSTLIESLMRKRNSIFIDLNPLCVFWMKAILNDAVLSSIQENYEKINEKFKKQQTKITFKSVQKFLPQNIPILAKSSKIKFLHELFTKEQMFELGLLKKLIYQVKDKDVRDSLLLAFSSTLTKTNLTYHPSKTSGPNGGNAGIFIYYCYRKAPEPTFLDLSKTFHRKVQNVIKAKQELQVISSVLKQKMKIFKGDATDLQQIENESIDYIYTDPPYGKKIEYLDLSTMWNAWLDLEVNQEDFEKETIEGGHLQKSKQDYSEKIIQSLQEMFRVLKWNRWLSFVFQHQDPFYWHLIVQNAERIGFEYAGCVKQTNGQTSFKKRQHPFSVLSGQLIINFRKVKTAQSIMKFDLGLEAHDFIINNIESVIAEKNGATIEEINEAIILNGLELGFLHEMSKYKDITDFLTDFAYNEETKKYHLKKEQKFISQIPLDKKIQYFLTSYLKQKNRKEIYPNFDKIILDILPLLKNGITPKEQTIKNILEKIAFKKQNGYKLIQKSQITLF